MHERTHLSSAQNPSMESYPTQSKTQVFPLGWALLPLQLHLSCPSSCSFTVVLLVPQACYDFHVAAPSIPYLRFLLGSSLTHLRSLLGCHINGEAFRDYLTWRVTHILPLDQPHQHCLSPFADLFYCVANSYQLSSIHAHVFITCNWKLCTLHEGRGSFIHYCPAVSIP